MTNAASGLACPAGRATIRCDGSIRGQWLQITVRATPATGLAEDYVFYFGSAVGDSVDPVRVDTNDEIAVRHNPNKTFLNPATLTNPCDHNRDGKADTTDEIITRLNATNFMTELKLIAVP